MRRLVSSVRVRFGIWLPLTGLMLVLGIAVSVFGAQSLASSEAKNARQRFRFSSDEIASSMKLAISNEETLVVNTSAHVVTTPDGTNAARTRSLDRISRRSLQRFPEIQNVGFTDAGARVTAGGLPGAAGDADPLRPFGSNGPPAWEAGIVPAKSQVLLPGRGGDGARSRGLRSAGPELLRPRADHDVRPRRGRGQLRARHGRRKNLTRGRDPGLQDGPPPSTVPARRHAFIGWLGELLVPDVVLERALEGHPNIAVNFGFSSPSAHFAFYRGHARQAR